MIIVGVFAIAAFLGFNIMKGRQEVTDKNYNEAKPITNYMPYKLEDPKIIREEAMHQNIINIEAEFWGK